MILQSVIEDVAIFVGLKRQLIFTSIDRSAFPFHRRNIQLVDHIHAHVGRIVAIFMLQLQRRFSIPAEKALYLISMDLKRILWTVAAPGNLIISPTPGPKPLLPESLVLTRQVIIQSCLLGSTVFQDPLVSINQRPRVIAQLQVSCLLKDF